MLQRCLMMSESRWACRGRQVGGEGLQPNVQEPEEEANYLSKLLSGRSLREVCLRLAARTLILLFMQHRRALGNGPVTVPQGERLKPMSRERTELASP